MGFAFSKAVEVIKRNFNGEIVMVEQIDNPLDWMPDHDFFPFASNCGRVFGISLDGNAYPFYTHNGASYSVPYILPFAPLMSKWTSIPQERTNSFSLFCLQKSLHLFKLLEKINRRDIMIGDLMNVHPRVSIPINVGQHTFPRLDTRVINFLSDACHELS